MHIPKEPYWHRRCLPHFEGGSRPQGVTFRLADSLPRHLLGEIQSRPSPTRSIEEIKRMNRILDKGYGAAWLSIPTVASIVQNALVFFDGDRYRLHAWVIMPNHVHVLFTPAEEWTLDKILHSWKSYSAREANKGLLRRGRFWQEEYFDRAIQDPRDFIAAIRYIENNPVKAALCEEPHQWPFSSAFSETR
ncbi:transposase [Geomonas sp. RF6]|uniref:REP-associated tyrosine transposase n=1 Tax=Geomonas sp. RF6 TaxID=2897342 RepID=UPI001E48281E|nr:transposase [Geomonas sp. RF6]UFS69788.1 transposase [Geomonas sp. RF6]